MKLIYNVTNKTIYKTVKEVLKQEFSMSDRLLLKLKKMQNIYLNKELIYVHHTINEGDLILCDLDYEEDNSNIVPNPMDLCILYEDDAYLVINKPAGIPVHPSFEHYTDSLSNGVRAYFDKIELNKKIRPVNRLDKDTSGLVVFAKNEYIQECLVKQMKSKDFVKKYIAIVDNKLEERQGTICVPISRKENSIIERCVNNNGETAITHYKVLNSNRNLNIFDNYNASCSNRIKENFNIDNIDANIDKNNYNYDIVECTLETGRTHQIRVHFAYIGHPLLGDTLYGKSSDLISRQALHCYYMSFIHPITKRKVCYNAKLPDDIAHLVNV